jgi:hypothetical protein
MLSENVQIGTEPVRQKIAMPDAGADAFVVVMKVL